jgi:hypothetical protein
MSRTSRLPVTGGPVGQRVISRISWVVSRGSERATREAAARMALNLPVAKSSYPPKLSMYTSMTTAARGRCAAALSALRSPDRRRTRRAVRRYSASSAKRQLRNGAWTRPGVASRGSMHNCTFGARGPAYSY